MQGFLGTNASFSADITLVIYIFVIIPLMIAGYVFARRKMFMPHHKFVMTGIVIINWVLIAFVMAVSYGAYVAPSIGRAGEDLAIALPVLHLITGGIAQFLATYLVLLMWTENTPFERVVIVRITNIKLPMRVTLGLWAITIALGVMLYVVWYVPATPAQDDAPAPVATEEAPQSDETTPLVTPEPQDDAPDDDMTDDDTPDDDAPDDDVPDPVATEEAGG